MHGLVGSYYCLVRTAQDLQNGFIPNTLTNAVKRLVFSALGGLDKGVGIHTHTHTHTGVNITLDMYVS